MIKKLNARQQYASMAQVLLRELLPRFDIEELVAEFKEASVGGGLKNIIEALDMYSAKHFTRADRNLKRTFYVKYVLSQMTLIEDKKQLESQANIQTMPEIPSGRKRDKKAARKAERKSKTNLFKE